MRIVNKLEERGRARLSEIKPGQVFLWDGDFYMCRRRLTAEFADFPCYGVDLVTGRSFHWSTDDDCLPVDAEVVVRQGCAE